MNMHWHSTHNEACLDIDRIEHVLQQYLAFPKMLS
jgi:hypothetical protein